MLRMLLRFGPFSFFQKGEEMLTMLRPHFGTFFQVAGITSQKSSRSSWARRGCQRVWTMFSHSLSKTLAVRNRLRLCVCGPAASVRAAAGAPRATAS